MSWNQIHAILADPATQTIAALIPIAWGIITFFTKVIWKKKGWLGTLLSKHDFIPLFIWLEGMSLVYAVIDALQAQPQKIATQPDRLAVFTQSFLQLTVYSVASTILYTLLFTGVKLYVKHRKATRQAPLKPRKTKYRPVEERGINPLDELDDYDF